MRHVWKTPPFVTVAAVLFALAAAAALGACSRSGDVARERADRARRGDGEIVVGAAWPWENRGEGLYWQGMEMALDEVNARGVLGRKLRIVRADDHESVNEGRLVAQRFADDPDVVAVIGHLNSHVSIPAAAIYEGGGVLMLTPASTSPELTKKGFRHVFRSINDDEKIGRQMVDYARRHHYGRVVICYVRNEYGLGLANAFEQRAGELGLEIVDRQSYDPGLNGPAPGFARLVDAWKRIEFDALFLAGMAPQAGHLVRQIRTAGIDAPIFGGDALDTATLIESAGEAAEGVVVASVFHPDNPRPEVQRFDAAFAARYGMPPDSWAVRGYEAVRVLAEAMERAGSPTPDRVAEALRTMEAWHGVTGPFSFDERGDVVGKAMVTAVVRDGRFAFLEENLAAEAPTVPARTASAP